MRAIEHPSWEQRKVEIEKLPDNTEFYIQNGYVGNCVSFWASGSAGYTCNLEYAQKYTK